MTMIKHISPARWVAILLLTCATILAAVWMMQDEEQHSPTSSPPLQCSAEDEVRMGSSCYNIDDLPAGVWRNTAARLRMRCPYPDGVAIIHVSDGQVEGRCIFLSSSSPQGG
jgi:hypothetical protein